MGRKMTLAAAVAEGLPPMSDNDIFAYLEWLAEQELKRRACRRAQEIMSVRARFIELSDLRREHRITREHAEAALKVQGGKIGEWIGVSIQGALDALENENAFRAATP